MSRELRMIAWVAVGIVAARVLVLAIDAIAIGLQRRSLYAE